MEAIFIVIGLPIIAYALLRAYQMYLMHRQLEKILEERKLLIEEGMTDLPPLEVPEMIGVFPKSSKAGAQEADAAQAQRSQEVSPMREEPTCAVPKSHRVRNLGILTQVGTLLLLFGALGMLAGVSSREFDALLPTGVIVGLVGLLFLLIYALTPREERERLAAERKANADPFGNLKAGLILLALAASSVATVMVADISFALPNGSAEVLRAIAYVVGLLLGFIGLALILIHIIVGLSMLGKRRIPPAPMPQDDTQILSR